MVYYDVVALPGGESSASADMAQDNMNQYRSIAEFEAVGTGELSVVEGEIVTVIEKNSSGIKNTSLYSG